MIKTTSQIPSTNNKLKKTPELSPAAVVKNTPKESHVDVIIVNSNNKSSSNNNNNSSITEEKNDTDWISLNVGGQIFTTTRTTLTMGKMKNEK